MHYVLVANLGMQDTSLNQGQSWPQATYNVRLFIKYLNVTTHLILVFHRLLHVRNGNCKYHLGEETFKLAQSYMDKLAKHGHEANKAALYGELCALLFAKSHYDEVWLQKHLIFYILYFKNHKIFVLFIKCVFVLLKFKTHIFSLFQAYRWCIEAMKEITPGLPVKVVVDVLRQASKVFSVYPF